MESGSRTANVVIKQYSAEGKAKAGQATALSR